MLIIDTQFGYYSLHVYEMRDLYSREVCTQETPMVDLV
jgi:hypothetical protein